MPRRVGVPIAAWLVTGLSTVAAFGLLASVDGSVEPTSFLAALGLLGLLGTLCWIYGVTRPDAILGPLLSAVTIVLWSGMMAGMISLMALRRSSHLIDPWLAGMDASFGFDAGRVTLWFAGQPRLVGLLQTAYESSFPLLMAIITYLAVTKRPDRVWALCFCFAVTITACAAVSAFAPAIGAFSYFQISLADLGGLPAGAGLYHRPVFDAFRAGTANTVDFRALQGVVTFPSFHTALALMSAFSLRSIRGLAIPLAVWNGIVVVSTIPIGGHYAIDVLAGALVWACAEGGAAVLKRRSPAWINASNPNHAPRMA